MRRFSLSSLRARLLLLVLIAVLPALGLIAYEGVGHRRQHAAEAQEEALRLARLASDEHRQLIEGAHPLLTGLAQFPAVRGQDSRACSSLFASILKRFPYYVNAGAAKPDGDIFCSAVPLPGPVNIADRDYFQRTLQMRDFTVSDYLIGRISGKPTLILTHPAVDDSGVVRAVVFLGLDLAWLNRLAAEARLPQGSVITVVDRNGRMLARHPDPEKWIGESVRDVEIVKTVLAQGEGVAEASGFDGIPRLFGFTPLHGLEETRYGYVWIGIPQDVAYAVPNRILVRNLVGVALAGVLAFVAAWMGADLFLLRRVNALVGAARRLGAGDLSVRTGLSHNRGELGQLAGAFDEMAEALARRGAEVERAQGAQRASEEALKQERDFISAVLDTMSALVVVLDSEGRIIRFNRACELTLGYRLDEVKGRRLWDLFLGPEEVEAGKTVFGDVLRGHRLSKRETHWIAKDGSSRLIVWSNTVLSGARGSVEYVVATGIDITERKQVEENLRKSEATARAFLESAGEGILVADRDGRIVLANAKIEQMFGHRRDELLGQPVDILLPERFRDVHVGHRSTYTSEPRVRPMGLGLDLAGRRKDGSEFPVEISLSFTETEEGIRIMAFITDITERLTLQRAARQSEKLAALGTLAAGLAHELNNPIGIIASRIDLMLMEAEGRNLPTGVREDLQVLHRNARRVARIAQGLLSFARQSPGQRGPVDLNRVVEDMLLLAGKQMTKEGIRINTTLDRALPLVLGDANALEQVILNLMTNSREAMVDGGEIRIETGLSPERSGWVRLVVADTGPGISPEELPKIFDPFYTTKPEGTGLGLSVSFGIIRDHQGTVDVQSGPGRGTTFILSFPMVPRGAA